MMYIDYTRRGWKSHLTYHVSEPRPLALGEVILVQADGDELEEVKRLVPEALVGKEGKRVVTWEGTEANLMYTMFVERSLTNNKKEEATDSKDIRKEEELDFDTEGPKTPVDVKFLVEISFTQEQYASFLSALEQGMCGEGDKKAIELLKSYKSDLEYETGVSPDVVVRRV